MVSYCKLLWVLKFPAAWSCFQAAFKGRWSQNQYHDIYIYIHTYIYIYIQILVRKSGHSRQLLQSGDESKFSQEAGQGGSRMRGWRKSWPTSGGVHSLGWFRSYNICEDIAAASFALLYALLVSTSFDFAMGKYLGSQAVLWCGCAKVQNLEGILGIQDFDCGVGYIPLQDEVHSWCRGPCHQLL